MVKRIDELTPAQEARMAEWADKWIEISLRTGPADREKFARGLQECYDAFDSPYPGNVVWVSSPLVLQLAAPVALAVIELRRYRLSRHAVNEAVRDIVDYVVHYAVGDAAVGQSIRDAVHCAVRGAAGGDAVDDDERRIAREHLGRFISRLNDGFEDSFGPKFFLNGATDSVRSAVLASVQRAVSGPVHNATARVFRGVDSILEAAAYDVMLYGISASARRAAGGAVDEAVDYGTAFHVIAAVLERSVCWMSDMKVQSSYCDFNLYSDSFFRVVCGLELSEGASAYEAVQEAAHQWFSDGNFVMACERPTAIHREPPSSTQEGPWHVLHCEDGPAIAYPDGWGVYAIHGVQIPFKQRHIVERPEAITVAEIEAEENTEIRRVMIDRYGPPRYVADSGATVVVKLAADYPIAGLRTGRLLLKEVEDDEPILYADLLNSTPEPDGSIKRYMLRIDPNVYDGVASRNLQAAVASTWRNADGSLVFKNWRDYEPGFES